MKHIHHAELDKLGVQFSWRDANFWIRPAQNTLAKHGEVVIMRRTTSNVSWRYYRPSRRFRKFVATTFGVYT